jgi:hypothetical protein
MTKTRHLFVGLAVALASWLTVNSAYALNQHSWISGTGSGAACTRTSPCGDFATATGATQAGGVISVLDSGDFGPLQIRQPVTIRADGADGGLVNLVGNFGIQILGGPSDVFTLEGLHLDGGGINFFSGARLHVLCVVANVFINGVVSGILFEPTGAGQLDVTDTVLMNNGSGAAGAGILVKPQSGGTAQVSLERVTVNGNAFGIAADGTGSSGGINMTIADSMVAGNSQDGIIATTPGGGAPIGVMITNSKSVNNAAFGIRSIGPGVTVRVKNSDVTGNNTGLSFSGGGALLTFGNNAVRANGSDGAFSGPVGLQ